MKIILYTTDCPKCKILKRKLDAKKVSYDENHSIDEMIAKGISHAPMLEVDGMLMSFSDANEWVNGQ